MKPEKRDLMFRLATRDDLSDIVGMLADDELGARREAYTTPLPESYYEAFEAIDRDPNNELVVAVIEGKVLGVLQMTFIPSISYQGRWRAQIEGVRVSAEVRSMGIGRRLLGWAIDRARQRDCHLVQLASHRSRTDAIRFYESLGFVASHEGMKLQLPTAEASGERM